MHRITLGDGWLLASSREVLNGRPQEPSHRALDWLPVSVPTTVQAALVAAGRAPSPWRDRNVEALRAFEKDTWWYRTEFTLPAAQADATRFELVLEGVSLFATVWLNGTPVGFLHNAHHEHRLDVTRHIRRGGTNVLVVECSLRLDEMAKRIRADISGADKSARQYMRMCQMSFGWDFAPRLAVIGLWRPVHVECHRVASVGDLHVSTKSIAAGTAHLAIAAQVRDFRPLPPDAALHLSIHEEPDGPAVWECSLPAVGSGRVERALDLPNARLWDPRPVGEPFLYTVKARVECDGSEADAVTRRFGIRTVELKQDGRFTFVVNGVEVFARGANWVPPNSLSLHATPQQYRHLLELAHDANFNMLRVWGGGTYESELFYDLCDELGIMVWQDFMYACAMYPDDDPEFMDGAAREARAVVARLRGHPSVVLWCGNNECQEAWVLGDWPERAARHFGERLYDHVLPETVAELCPEVPYWPGSPYGGPTTRSRSVGDFHDWYSLPNWRTYDENAPLFSSEYGFRSVPQRETVDEMISRELQWDERGPQHIVWKFHHGYCGWLQAILPEFGVPKTLDEYIMLTQEAQATLMRYALEVYRRRMFGTSGALMWQYDEPWPAATFSLVDFFGRAKAAYYWARHGCAPVMGMFYEKGGELSFWGVSDLPCETPCALHLRRFDHSGALLGEATVEGRLPPNAATMLLEALPAQLAIVRPERELLHAHLRASHMTGECCYHASQRKDWVLPAAVITGAAKRVAADRVEVMLSSATYVHFVSLSVSDPAARYWDNFFDLLPGIARTIEVRTRDAGEVTVRAANAPEQRLCIR